MSVKYFNTLVELRYKVIDPNVIDLKAKQVCVILQFQSCEIEKSYIFIKYRTPKFTKDLSNLFSYCDLFRLGKAIEEGKNVSKTDDFTT